MSNGKMYNLISRAGEEAMRRASRIEHKYISWNELSFVLIDLQAEPNIKEV